MRPDPRAEGLRWFRQAEHDSNSLPGGIPAEAFDESDARRALQLASEVLAVVKAKLASALAG